MANIDNPNGFTPHSPAPRVSHYTAGGTFAKGDLVKFSSGAIVIHSGTDMACGVAATAGTSGEACLIYDDPTTVFVAQTEGTYTEASHAGVIGFDVSGSSGAQEVECGSNTDKTILILRQHFQPGSMEPDTGAGIAHARVLCTITEHSLGGHTA